MKLKSSLGLAAVLAPTIAVAAPVQVLMDTSLGAIKLELNPDKAPKTVENFLRYVREGHYDGTIFHRVISGFMIQGGGYDRNFHERPTHAPIKNESDNGLSNVHGAIAMARTSDPDSATAQFFINQMDNMQLDGGNGRAGYAVFGRVIEGMKVVDKIAGVRTGPAGPFRSDAPREFVVINKVTVIEPAKAEKQ